MSYVADNTTRAEFLAERKIRSRQVAQVALNQFYIFCKSQYGKDVDIVIRDILDTGITDKAYVKDMPKVESNNKGIAKKPVHC